LSEREGRISLPMIPERVEVVCLLVGRRYPPIYVERLHSMLKRHMPVPFRLTCITDVRTNLPSEINVIELSSRRLRRREHRTMYKLSLFDRSFLPFHEFLYLDITIVIPRDMTPLLEFAFGRREDLVVLQDWNYDCYNSCVMRIRHSDAMQTIVDDFDKGTKYECLKPGDQDFIHASVKAHGLQERVALFPQGMIASYRNARELVKSDPAGAHAMLDNAVIVKFFGRHKMHHVENPLFRLRLSLQKRKYGADAANFWLPELQENWR
jgi:hypothetical protein